MLRLQPTDVFDAKVNQIQEILQKSFAVQKTILNGSSVCFQIEVSFERTDVSRLWRLCVDIDERFDCRCFLTLTRCSAELNPKIQVIVDTDDRRVGNENDNVDSSATIENVLEVFGCDSNYYVFHLPGVTMIKCALPLDKDGILDLGGILNVAKEYWGQRCKNVSLFGNAENVEGVQTIYVSVEEYGPYYDETESENDMDVENEADAKENLQIDRPSHAAESVAEDEVKKNIEEEEGNVLTSAQRFATSQRSLQVESRDAGKSSLSRLARGSLFAVLTGLTGIVIHVVHLVLMKNGPIE
jgi:hypothetical protein